MILIALGANLPSRYGAPSETLRAAVARIDAHHDIIVERCSAIYKSAPVPVSDQPWYHNAVISVETRLEPLVLLSVLQGVEADFGRVRVDGARNMARILDLDIVDYHSDVVDQDGLEIPHPRMADRAFVLFPLSDVSSDWKHPVSGASIDEMIDALPDGQNIQKIDKELV